MRRAWPLLLLAALAAAVWVVTAGAGAADDGTLLAQPMLGSADPDTELMGVAGEETWAYRVLPAESGAPAGIEFGPANGDQQQLAFVRYTRASGWQVAET